VEFVHPEVAQIVADTMNDYLLFKKKLVCRAVPPVAAAKIKWPLPGPAPEKSLFTLQRSAANYYNSKNKDTPVDKLIAREERKRTKLKKLGIDYQFDGYTALVNNLTEGKQTQEPEKEKEKEQEKEVTKTTETEDKEVAEKRKRQEEEVWVQRKQTKDVADETPLQKKRKLNKEKLNLKSKEKKAAKKAKKALAAGKPATPKENKSKSVQKTTPQKKNK